MEEHESLGEEENQLQKPSKKNRSPAQIEAFEKARAKRIENAKIKNEKINEIKEQAKTKTLTSSLPTTDDKTEVIKKEITKQSVLISKLPKPKKEPKIIYQDESGSEEEVIIVKKKKKQPKKKIIYEEEESESESEEENPNYSKAMVQGQLPHQAPPRQQTQVNPQIQSRQFIRFF